MFRSALLSSAVLALAFLAAPGAAHAQEVAAAVRTGDAAALAALSETASSQEARLARAALAALHHQDAAAIPDLRAAARSRRLSAETRLSAYQTLGSIYLRQGRFADAAAALADGAALGVTQEPERAHTYAQAQAFAAALAHEAPMRARVPAGGDLPLTRDMAQLLRADVTINGAAHSQAILDTGAAYSTIMRSVAEQLGLRFVDSDVTVGSSSHENVPAQLAIADTLTLGGAEFHNVVFIVFPDEALTFAGGAYRIEAIVGLPVLIQLGRLEFALGASGDHLHYTRAGGAPGPAPNLLVDGLQPIAVVQSGDATLRMLLDTGAQNSQLSRIVERDYPALLEGAEERAATIGGAGGVRTDAQALSIPRLTLNVAGRDVALSNVRLMRAGRAMDRHGILGQDVLRSGGGYVLDFQTMRFELLERG